MKKSHDLPAIGIETGKVRTLVFIIVMAGQREIICMVCAAVLFGNDMFHMEPVEWLVVLMNPAILAPMLCPPPDPFPRPGIHRVGSAAFKSLRAFAWMMAR